MNLLVAGSVVQAEQCLRSMGYRPSAQISHGWVPVPSVETPAFLGREPIVVVVSESSFRGIDPEKAVVYVTGTWHKRDDWSDLERYIASQRLEMWEIPK